MESMANTIVIFGIFSFLWIVAQVSFVCLDQKAKEDYKWLWIILALFGPVTLIPYFIWGRER